MYVKRTFGYLIALFLGLFIGWVAQQFWISQHAVDTSYMPGFSLSRQYQRLNALKENSEHQTPSETLSVPVTEQTSSSFRQAVSEKQFDLAIEYLLQLESVNLKDALIIAELAFELDRFEWLISFLYEFRYGLDMQTEQRLLKEIYLLVEKIDAKLGEANDLDSLVNLYRLLTSLEGDNTFYYLRLSYWLLQSGNVFEASQSLLGAVNDFEFQDEIKHLQESIDLYEKIGPRLDVPMKMVGEHYLVNVSLGAGTSFDLMLDTGASKTVVKRGLLTDSLFESMEDAKKITMNTANGQTQGVVLRFDNVSISSLKVNALDVVILDLPDFKYDGLLGMNLLSQFDFKIDQDDAILSLAPKKPAFHREQ